MLRSAVVVVGHVVGHVEVPFTLRRQGTPNIPLEARDPAKLSALAKAGVRVASLGANHLYEKQIARAAVDAGADLVIGHHAHILRGIELYKDKPIYHGLGNFVTVTHALSPQGATDPDDWALRRIKLFGFSPDPETPEYPFHPESQNTVLAKVVIDESGQVQPRLLPVYINRLSQPEVLGRDSRGQAVVDYVETITRQAGFNTRFAWDGDEVRVVSG